MKFYVAISLSPETNYQLTIVFIIYLIQLKSPSVNQMSFPYFGYLLKLESDLSFPTVQDGFGTFPSLTLGMTKELSSP
jgi:hypothetical protein